MQFFYLDKCKSAFRVQVRLVVCRMKWNILSYFIKLSLGVWPKGGI